MHVLGFSVAITLAVMYMYVHVCPTLAVMYIYVRSLHLVTLRMEGGGGRRPATDDDCIESEYIIV